MLNCQKHLFNIPPEITYMNTAYMSPSLNSVVEAIDHGNRRKSQPWRIKQDDFFEEVDIARSLFANIVKADEGGIAIVPSAAYGLSTAAKNLSLGTGKKILVLCEQFPSNMLPWKKKARDSGSILLEIKMREDRPAHEAILEKLDESVSIVALPNVLWTNGLKIDLQAIRVRCDEIGSALVLDLTQSTGAMEINFKEIRPDFAVVANYKWMLGPYNTGFLYVAPKYRDGKPLEEGWVTRKGSRNFVNLTECREEYESGAVRFDVGETSNFALMPGVIASLRQLLDWGVSNIHSSLESQNDKLCLELEKIGLVTTPKHIRGPHFIGAKLPRNLKRDIISELASQNIYLSRRGDSIRITPHLWNTDEDFRRLVWALGSLL